MNNEILNSLQSLPAVQELLEGGNDLGNLNPMEEALLLKAAFDQDCQSRIIVKKNKYEAQQLYERLSLMDERVLLFVMEESLRVQAIAASPEEKENELRALNEMRSESPRIIIVNTAAYLRHLPNRKVFDSLCFTLQQDDEMSMKELSEKLNRTGFGRVSYVERPGSYAMRGGIVDVWPLNQSHPVRIEFFDSLIESIRTFDENTQRTIQSIEKAEIIPASDLLFSDEEIQEIESNVEERLKKEVKKLPEEKAETLESQIEEDLEAIKNYDTAPRLYRYYAWISSGSLLDYTDGKVIWSASEDIEPYYKNLVMDNISYMQEEVEEGRALPKYSTFHDVYTIAKKRKPEEIHQFMSLENPIETGIRTIEPPTLNYMEWIQNEAAKDNVYFALEKEDIHLIGKNMDTSVLKLTEPVFYQGFETDQYTVYTRKEIFRQTNRRIPYQKTFAGSTALGSALELEPGDYIVHAQYGIGQYIGIVTRESNKVKTDYLHAVYKDGDELYVPLNQFQQIRKYVSKEGAGVKLSKLGSGQWEKTKKKVSAKVEEIAGRLVDLYAARTDNIGFAYPKDDILEKEFDEAFEYEATPDQIRATAEIKEQMELPKPMDHLLIGDVGFGKTEVAMRCAFKAVAAGKQAAFLCPTTILSLQHYQTLSKRFEGTGVRVELVNRFISQKEMTQIIQGLKDGTIDIVVGTHRLFNKNIKYKDLGFLIIDEEQRFGVEHKEKIKEMKNSVDVLSLSATPIPRTLQMSLIGVRTISQLNTPPAHRHPIQTYIIEKKGQVIQEIIQRELSRNGQVFYLHNRVEDIYQTAKTIQDAFPDVKVGVAHGRMSRDEIEDIMLDFSMNKFQILVCTTIIETGLDIANANTIIIEDADRFGLAQLYQIRGRVGRRERLAYCYLMVPPKKQLSEASSKRLKSIKEFTQLGSGYKIAMRDLTIRGAGDMLGPQQAGFIDSVGLDLYLEMLSEAIARKKGEAVPEKVEEKTTNIQTGGYIPEAFADQDGDKLDLYQKIKGAKSLKELEEYKLRTADLFGEIPPEVVSLFNSRRIELFANEPGVDTVKETNSVISITMDEKWSSEVNGLKLFQAISALSRQISLSYKNKRILISFAKKNNWMHLLLSIIDILQDPEYRKTR